MNCPKCNVPLSMTDRQGVEIDYCPQCRGVWLDRGELDKIIERSAAFAGPAPGPAAIPGVPPPLPPQPPPQGQAPYEQPRRRRDDDDDDDDYYRRGHGGKDYPYGKKKKKSFLGDLFDF